MEMANDDFSIFSVKAQGGYKLLKGIKNEEVITQGIQESGGLDQFRSALAHGTYPTNIQETRVHLSEDQQQRFWMQNNLENSHNAKSMPLPAQSIFEFSTNAKHEKLPNLTTELCQPINLKPHPISTATFELLSNYRREDKRSRDGNLNNLSSQVTVSDRKLSTEEIMRVAGERYIQFSAKKPDRITTFIHPYGSALSSLSTEETTGADLVHVLLTAAEKVGYKQFYSASKLVAHCECMASESGNAVERVVFYFAEALRERINRETGSMTINTPREQARCPNGLSAGANLTLLATHQGVPFSMVMQFASMQTILENVEVATKIHLIDLQMRNGIQWTPLIQALSERKTSPVEILKVTALGTTDKQKIEETGKRLESYAKSLNIPFSFKVAFVSDMKDVKQELFDVKHGETVVVYSPVVLRSMISRPDGLETLMRVIRSLKPSIMVVTEVEASHNSPSFVNRFIEALFFYSAWFDCLDDCMDLDNQYRMDLERIHFGEGIRNIVATEGEERIIRSVKINVWREFFARFKMAEVELSKAALNQASMVLQQQFSCGTSCTLENDGKCLIVGWKGTPMHSVSTWKFGW